jgi:hypothetical protein
MKNLLKFAFAALFAAILLAGCAQDNNPVAPSDGGNGNGNEGGGDPVIKTPIYMSIENISVKGFPKNKSNGDTWDFDLFSSTERKPDIEVILQKDGSSSPVFWSDMRRNADYKSTYVFTNAKSSSDGSLPYSVPQSQTYRVKLIDVDLLANDDMGYVKFSPSSIYKDDNATTFDYTATRNGVKIKIRGSWIY